MSIAQSKLTAQNQISVPAEIRRRLGLEPGAVMAWEEDGDRIIVRRATKYTLEEVHKTLFPDGPPKRRSLKELKKAPAKHVKEQHARGRY